MNILFFRDFYNYLTFKRLSFYVVDILFYAPYRPVLTPRPPPKEGGNGFPSFGGVPEGRGGEKGERVCFHILYIVTNELNWRRRGRGAPACAPPSVEALHATPLHGRQPARNNPPGFRRRRQPARGRMAHGDEHTWGEHTGSPLRGHATMFSIHNS
jgi:hypothetical protein